MTAAKPQAPAASGLCGPGAQMLQPFVLIEAMTTQAARPLQLGPDPSEA